MRKGEKARSTKLSAAFYASKDARFHHRLHSVFLVKSGVACSQVARLFGDSTRAVQTWVKRYGTNGIEGLMDAEREGRPPRLTRSQMKDIKARICSKPSDCGSSPSGWNGKSLSEFIQENYGIRIGPRQCQRYIRQLESDAEK